MTSPFEPPVSLDGRRIAVEIHLCAESETTLLERVEVDTPRDVIDLVRSRHGIPSAVLRQAVGHGTEPIGWVVPAPDGPTTTGRVVATAFGPIRTPSGHVEIVPLLQGPGLETWPALPLYLLDDGLTDELSANGLIDAAGDAVPRLWREYRRALEDRISPADALQLLLSVHRRARSAGTMPLAAHTADAAGHLLHRSGAWGAAATFHRWALGVYARAHLDLDGAVALTNLTHALWHDGRHGVAVEAGLRALDLARRCHDGPVVQRAAMITSHALADAGRAAEAIDLLTTTPAPVPSQGPSTLGWWQHAVAAAHLASGDTTRAAVAALRAGRHALAVGDHLQAEVHDLLAAIATARGDAAAAAAARAAAASARRRLPPPLVH